MKNNHNTLDDLQTVVNKISQQKQNKIKTTKMHTFSEMLRSFESGSKDLFIDARTDIRYVYDMTNEMLLIKGRDEALHVAKITSDLADSCFYIKRNYMPKSEILDKLNDGYTLFFSTMFREMLYEGHLYFKNNTYSYSIEDLDFNNNTDGDSILLYALLKGDWWI